MHPPYPPLDPPLSYLRPPIHVQGSSHVALYYVISFLNPAGMDFQDTATDLTFNRSSPTQTAMVSILNDPVPENMFEYFSLILASTDRAAILDPTTANVTIVDDMDSKNHQMSVLGRFIFIAYVCGIQSMPNKLSSICSGYNWIQPSNLFCI